MASTISPMTLGDIFDRTFSMIGKTFWRNLAIAFTFMIIPAILFTISAHRFYSSMPDFGGTSPNQSIEAIGPFISGSVYFGIASLLFALGAMMAEIAITLVIGRELSSERIDYATALRLTFDRRWLNGIGEGLLKSLGLCAFVVVATILGVIIGVSVGRGNGSSSPILILFTVLFILVLVAALFYFIIRLYFALTAVAVEDLGPINALKKSWHLVGDHWWRTLGILILFFILSGFAISVVTVPVTFGSMWNEYKHFFTMLGETGGQVAPSQLRHLQMSLGPLVGISSGLSSLLSLLITPAFTVVMYFDLRARHNDLPAPEPPAPTEDVPVQVI